MIDPALSGLAGVGIGSASTYWIERGRDKRREDCEARAGRHVDERSMTRGARLVLTDLFTVIGLMKATYDSKAWLLDIELPEAAWQQERGALSEILDDRQWRDVATAYMNIAVWNDLIRALRKGDPLSRIRPHAKLADGSDEGLSGLRDTLIQTCGQGADSIRPIALSSIDDDDSLAVFLTQASEPGEE